MQACKKKSLLAGQLVAIVADHESFTTWSHYCFSFADDTAVLLMCDEANHAVSMRLDSAGFLSFRCAEMIVKEAWLCDEPSQLLFYTYPLSVGLVDSADATSLLPTLLPQADAEPIIFFLRAAAEPGKSAKSAKIDSAVKEVLAELGVAKADVFCFCDSSSLA